MLMRGKIVISMHARFYIIPLMQNRSLGIMFGVNGAVSSNVDRWSCFNGLKVKCKH